MWFAVFDYEHPKEKLLGDKKYYKIGLNSKFTSQYLTPFSIDSCFNNKVFWRWIFYGAWQGLVVLFICFYSMEKSADSSGSFASIHVDGQFVYMAVVMTVNFKIMTSTSNHTPYSLFFSIGSILCYMLFFYLINLWTANELYGLFV